jgi:hypothetical protein
MALVVIGGHSRNIGKTSVAAGLIASLSDRNWTAIKITQYGHGRCSMDGQECECSAGEHPYAITDEASRKGDTDTSRFLKAGAARALWVRVRLGELEKVVPKLEPIIEASPFTIIESNSILRYVRPDLYIVVLKYDVEDWKTSARSFLEKADAAVVVQSKAAEPSWDQLAAEALDRIPKFTARAPEYVPESLAAWVDQRLRQTA